MPTDHIMAWRKTARDRSCHIILSASVAPCSAGLLVPILVGSALGLVLIVSLVCCLLRQKR